MQPTAYLGKSIPLAERRVIQGVPLGLTTRAHYLWCRRQMNPQLPVEQKAAVYWIH